MGSGYQGPPFVVASSTFTQPGDSGNTVVALPSGMQENDFVVISRACDNFMPATVPTGWSSDYSAPSAAPNARLLTKRMGAVPDATVELEETTVEIAGIVEVWRGVSTTNAFDTAIAEATGSAGAPDAPGVTSTTSNATHVAIGFVDDDDVSGIAVAPTGYSTVLVHGVGPANGSSVMSAHKVLATAGADNPAEFGGGIDDNWVAISFALRAENP